MVIVADSSPLICFAILDKLSLLESIFETLLVPEEVYNELVIPTKPYSEVLSSYLQDKIRKVGNTLAVNLLCHEVDRGEAEAIVLALEQNIERIIIDDSKGRRVARKEGLKPIGTIGILLQAKAHGLLHDIKPLLDELIKNGIRISESLYESALKQGKE